MAKQLTIYDTTLRDGTQAENFNLSVEDKIRVSLKLDDLGIDFIEGGWPGANPRDMEYFKKARKFNLEKSKVVAFGSTHRPKHKVEKDVNIKALLDSLVKIHLLRLF